MSQLLYIPFLILLIAQASAKDLFPFNMEELKKAAIEAVVERHLVPLLEEPVFMDINCNPISTAEYRCSAKLKVLINDPCVNSVSAIIRSDGTVIVIQAPPGTSSNNCIIGVPLNLKPFTLPGMEEEKYDYPGS